MTSVLPTRRERTRDALLVALQELLLDPDTATVSVPQVVGRAGVAQGTFYHYFDSLPDAIDALGGLLLAEHARVLGLATAGAADTAEIVARSARQTLLLFARRPDVGQLIFDSALPVDRVLSGVRAHLHADLRAGTERGDLTVPDLQVAETVYAGTIMGACLDIHRGRLPVDAAPGVIGHLLAILGVSARRTARLVAARGDFVEWRPLPLSALWADTAVEGI